VAFVPNLVELTFARARRTRKLHQPETQPVHWKATPQHLSRRSPSPCVPAVSLPILAVVELRRCSVPDTEDGVVRVAV
jgi:hypothetical protein